MTQDNIQTDTPVKETQNTETQEVTSLEEVVFGEGFNEGSDVIQSAFPEGEDKAEETAPVEGQPVESNSNDEKRYQYWQSQADKMKNENAQLRNTLATQSRTNYDTANQPTQPVDEANTQPVIEEFPAPPNKPSKPGGYSREEAYTDPNSNSAKYLDEVEQWRDDIIEYNQVKSQYDTAIQQERTDAMERRRVEDAKRAEAHNAQKAQAREIFEYVQGNHGMSREEATDFMKTMSDPKSISTDNLVQLYRIQKSGGETAKQNTPSQDFQQVQRAQQVPTPMGVMPSGNSGADTKSFEDKIMDNLIGDFNSKNPWK